MIYLGGAWVLNRALLGLPIAPWCSYPLQMVASQPNESHVLGSVRLIQAADDGWGSWVDLHIESVRDVPGKANWGSDLVGRTIRAFAPPPIAAAIYQAGGAFEGTLTVGPHMAGHPVASDFQAWSYSLVSVDEGPSRS